MSKGKSQHQGRKMQYGPKDGSRVTMGDALGLPPHTDACVSASNAAHVAWKGFEVAKRKIALDPEFAEFEKIRSRFYSLRNKLTKKPEFSVYEKSRAALTKSLEAKDKGKPLCERCCFTDPKLRAKKDQEEQAKAQAPAPAAVAGPNGNGVANAASAVPATASV